MGSIDLGHALAAFWTGAFGSSFTFFSVTLVRATPLLFLGLAVSLSFRAGLLNIGADGQFLMGAAAAASVALAGSFSPRIVVLLGMVLAGMLAGCAWAGIAAELRRRFGVLEVISTLMLNFVALYVVAWLVRGPLQEHTRTYPQTESFTPAGRWPLLFPGQRLHLGFPLALALAAFLWWILTSMAIGFRVRSVGASPRAAASAGGIDVERTIFRVFLASGALAGLAGAAEVGGLTWALYEGISPGYGYTAIAVALLARLDMRWVVVTAVFFGALQAGAAAMQRDADVPATVVTVAIALVVL
ncbi:MAG TPA: ABC transporter permease, partial [Gemmatimonadaceae bacterium]|nr:ABC transporter permease [Gemmatimonadaceae bacterium]